MAQYFYLRRPSPGPRPNNVPPSSTNGSLPPGPGPGPGPIVFPLLRPTAAFPLLGRHPMAAAAARSLRRSISAARTLPRRDLIRRFTIAAEPDAADPSRKESDAIFVKAPPKSKGSSGKDGSGSVTMPVSFMTGSIVGKRFYREVTTRESDDGCGWNVMLDYRTLKTPSKRVLKLPSLALAKAIAAEWEYQQTDGIRPFTMPLMKLACTALERVPLTRHKIVEHLLKKFHQDLVFCRSPGDNALTSGVLERQIEKIDPLLSWVEKEFGFKPVLYTSFFGGKQEDSLVRAVEKCLLSTTDCELASIDAMTAAAHSLVIALGIFRGRLEIDEAVELIRLEEDLQIDRWGLVEGGHDVDIADLKVQVSSAAVFLGLSKRE